MEYTIPNGDGILVITNNRGVFEHIKQQNDVFIQGDLLTKKEIQTVINLVEKDGMDEMDAYKKIILQ